MAIPERLLGPRHCAAHRTAWAGWRCTGCARTLCPACALRRPTGTGELVTCGRCGEAAATLRVRRRLPEPSRLISDLLHFPWNDGGRAFAVIAGMLAFSRLLWVPGGLFATALLASYAFHVLRETGTGRDDVPGFQEFDHPGEFMAALYRAGLGLVLVAVPWVLYDAARVLLGFGTAHGPSASDPLGIVAIAAGLAWSPIALVITGVGSPLRSIIDPFHAARVAWRVGPGLWLVVAPFWLAAGGWFALGSLAEWLTEATNVWILPGVVLEPVRVALAMIAARALGLLVRAHGADVGWGDADEWTDPALGGTRPLEAAPFVGSQDAPAPPPMEPIELPEESFAPREEFREYQPGADVVALELPEEARRIVRVPEAPTRPPTVSDDLVSEDDFLDGLGLGAKKP